MMEYAKYHGCGNDFIICEYNKDIEYEDLAKKICNRYIGIGADTLVVIEPLLPRVWFYNADGSLAPMCGNGIRCAAAYLKEKGYVKESTLDITTDTGIRKVYYLDNDLYSINMGSPSYKKEDLDLDYQKDELFSETFVFKSQEYNLTAIFFTTHHLIIPVDDLNISSEIGEYFCKHPIFTKMINVDFVKVIDEKTIIMKTYERGCGFTKACGSGATSSVVVMNRKGLVQDEVEVIFEYGTITITKKNNEYYMTGPATKVAEGIKFNC